MSLSRADDGNWTVLTALGAAYDAFRDNYFPLVATAMVWLLPAIALDLLGFSHTLVVVVELLIAAVLTMALAPAITESLLGHPIPLTDSLMLSVKRLRPSSFVLAPILLLGVAGGFVLLILPGLYMLAIWSVAAPVLIAERMGPMAALGRSMALTRGRVLRIVLVIALFAFIVVFVGAGFKILLAWVPDSQGAIWVRLLVWVLDAVFISVSACLTTVLYCLLRFDKEGITLELVTDSLH